MNFYKFKILKYSFPFQRLIFISRPETSTQGVIKFPKLWLLPLFKLHYINRGRILKTNQNAQFKSIRPVLNHCFQESNSDTTNFNGKHLLLIF